MRSSAAARRRSALLVAVLAAATTADGAAAVGLVADADAATAVGAMAEMGVAPAPHAALEPLLLAQGPTLPEMRSGAVELPAQTPQYTEFGLSQSREILSNNPNAWGDTQLDMLHKFAPRKLLIGRATSSERFGLRDRTLGLSGYYPLAARTTAYAELTSSDTHRVLARDSLHLQLAQALSDGWGVLGGLRHVNYNSTAVDVADLTLERYFSDYRIALSAYPSRSQIAGGANSYRLQFSRYYGAENNLQFLIARGTEVDKPTGVDSVLAASVRAVALFGRHWLTRDVSLVYSIGRTVQGESTRRAASLGLRYRF